MTTRQPSTDGAGLLVVTAVEAEATAVRAGVTSAGGSSTGLASTGGGSTRVNSASVNSAVVQVAAVGVGPAAAAAGTARLLALAEAAGRPYRAVLSAGIAGGFADRAPVGTTVIGRRSIAADLGAETPDGFVAVDDLGFGTSVARAEEALLKALTTALPEAIVGDIVTLSTVTGSAATAAGLALRFPSATAEAMEGYGVACAAAGANVPFAEVRTVSNPIGPRDRAAWRIPEALAALTAAATIFATLLP